MGEAGSQPEEKICIQAVNIDFYIEPAEIADELNHQYPHPVIRLFGSLKDGTRACAHIHGVQMKCHIVFPSLTLAFSSILGLSVFIFPTGGNE